MLAARHEMQGLVLLGAAVLAVVLIVWHFSRSRGLLEQWAAQNGYRLLSSEYRWMARGPFFWSTGKGQTVYRVRVQDRSGQVRDGWVKCGGFFLGLLSDAVKVRWDDEY